jgi:hypothetical protein
MIISATLTNGENCQFDSVTFDARWGVSNREATAIKTAKRWAAGRGGEYGLEVSILNGHGEGYRKSIGEFYYSGQCKRGVAL